MTTKAIADWLETAVTTALTVTVYRGYPAWGRPGVVPPMASLLWASLNPAVATTTGRSQTVKQTAFDVVTYATDEIQLWSHVDLLDAYWQANATPTISSQRVKVIAGEAVRLTADEVPEQARYACRQQITIQHT